MSVTYAGFEQKRAFFSGQFAIDMAQKWFGLSEKDLEEMLGRNTKGKNKGKIRGYISWYKVTSFGWVRTGPTIEYASGFPCKMPVVFAKGIFKSNWTEMDECLEGFDDSLNVAYALEESLAEAYKEKINSIREYNEQKQEA